VSGVSGGVGTEGGGTKPLSAIRSRMVPGISNASDTLRGSEEDWVRAWAR
jgi:hypothetical protein